MTKKHISLERTIGEYNVLSWSIAISTFILYMIITLVGAAAIGFFIYKFWFLEKTNRLTITITISILFYLWILTKGTGPSMEKFLKKWNIIYEVIVLGGRPLHKKEPEDAELKQKMDKAKKLSVVFNIIVYLAIPFFLTTIIMREIDFNHIIYMLIASTIWCILSKLFLEYEVKYINSLLKQMGDKIVVIEEP